MTTLTPDRSEMIRKFGLDKQNVGTLGRLLAIGNIDQAEEGPDVRMIARVRIVPD